MAAPSRADLCGYAGGSCCSLGGRGEGMEGEQQTKDQGVLPAGVRVSGAAGLGVEGCALVSLLSSSACPLEG